MKITVNTGGLQVNFADMVKDVKLIYTNVGNLPFLVDFVDPAGETKTTVVPPAGRYTISSNAGNPTGGRLTFSTESGQTYMVVSKVQEDSTVDGVDEKGYLTGTASKDEVTSLQQEVTGLSDTVDEVSSDLSSVKTDVQTVKTKTQNQSATSGNTSLTGNLTVSGTISTGSMSDIAGKVSQNQSAISGIQTDVAMLALSKLSAGTLHFNQGKLMVNSWTNLSVSLPISLCIEYDVASWEGLGTGDQGLSFITSSSVQWTDPVQLSGVSLRYNNTANRLEIILMNPGGATQSAKAFGAYFNSGLSALPTGKHTIVFCASGEINEGVPSEYAMYVDGQAVGVSSVYFSSMISTDLTSSGPLSVCQKINYSTSNVGGVDIPICLSRVRIFNFQMDAEDSPYTVADYVSGKDVPPALYDPTAAQRALLALEDYTISRNSTTRLVKDVSGNAYDATVVESGGSGGTAWTGTVKGSRDTAVKAFVDEIKTQINQANG